MFDLDKHNDHLHSVVNNMKFNSFNVETYRITGVDHVVAQQGTAK